MEIIRLFSVQSLLHRLFRMNYSLKVPFLLVLVLHYRLFSWRLCHETVYDFKGFFCVCVFLRGYVRDRDTI